MGAPPAEPAASPEGKAHQSNIKFKIGNEAEMRNRFELRLKKSDTAFEGTNQSNSRKLCEAQHQGLIRGEGR